MRLNVTNGDIVVDRLRRGGVEGELVPWRDVLHEGPVPSGLSLEELSRVRARFLARDLDDRPFEQVLSDLSSRDEALRSFKRFEEVTLWFEHDLYDQLQLLQVLHWFARRELGRTRLSLVCTGRPSEPEQLAGLLDARVEVTPQALELARTCWEAFCSDRPLRLLELTREPSSALPPVGPALVRYLEQFPWTRDGLSRSERQVLECLADGPVELGKVFRVAQIEKEENPFMSDRVFLYRLGSICGGKANLVRFVDGAAWTPGTVHPADDEIWRQELTLTEIGERILAGQADYVRLYGIDRWHGGVHLEGSQAAWRWDGTRRTLIELTGN